MVENGAFTSENFYDETTIAAIATPSGNGGIGIIRVSGANAFEIAGRHFLKGKLPDDKSSICAGTMSDKFSCQAINMLSYGYYITSNGECVDEVMCVKMKAPHSFTAEDVVEFQCHGGSVVLREILNDLLSDGAVLAAPGEFTKRAFLNGRIDLSQAEAVMELIGAKSKSSSRAALSALQGRLSKKIGAAKTVLVSLMAQLEVNADYPEYDVEILTQQKLQEGLQESKILLQELLKTYDRGRVLRQGITIAITGKPNVGKSSLLNFLVGHDKAIVSDIPGTTRDPIEEYVEIDGVPVRLVDTAGIRNSDNVIEQMGVDKAKDIVANADVAILMLDAKTMLQNEDAGFFEEIESSNKIVLVNKMDLVEGQDENFLQEKIETIRQTFNKDCDRQSYNKEHDDVAVIAISVKEETGIENLYSAIGIIAQDKVEDHTNDVILTNERHKALIERSIDSLDNSLDSLEMGMPNDMVAIDIIDAMNALGEITGDSIRQDIEKEIFEKFCIGK